MDLRYVVTTKCNANCFFCLNEYIGSKSGDYITSPQNYQDISKVALELGADGSTITGGEPTLRKDLEQIVSNIKKTGLSVTVVSNGYKLKDHMTAWKEVDKLHVSYHSFDSNEWKKITNVSEGPKIVADNLMAIRDKYPNLIIRLNVVATNENSKTKSFNKYLDLAQRINANISVFQNGYLRILKEIGKLPPDQENPPNFWDIPSMNGKLVNENLRIRTYQLGNVKIHLTYLSSEMHNGSSIWITPMSEGFADIRKRSKLIDFAPSLKLRDLNKIKDSLLSLSKESILLKEMEQNNIKLENSEEYKKLVIEREEKLDITNHNYFF